MAQDYRPSQPSNAPSQSPDATTTPTQTSTAYDSIEIDIQWYPEDDSDVTLSPSSEDMTILFLNLQLFYDEISDEIGSPRHYLQVDRIIHPNMSLSLKGLGEPIKALQAFLESVPKLIVSIWTIPKRIKEENIRIETNIQMLSVAKAAMREYKNAPTQHKKEYLQEFLRYTLSQEKITSPVPLSIRPSSQARSRTRRPPSSDASIEVEKTPTVGRAPYRR